MTGNTVSAAPPIDQITYWREDGGQRWTTNIDHVEAMIAPFNELLLAHAGAQPAEFVLDVGCGGATTSACIGEAVGPRGKVLGVDVSPVILSVAKQRFSHLQQLELLEADAANHRFARSHFDLLVSRFGVMFFEDPVKALSNLNRALKPGARMVFVCWRSLQENPWMEKPAAVAFDILGPPPPTDPDAPGPFAFADPGRLRAMLCESGFSDIELREINLSLELGSVEDNLKFLTTMGPAATALKAADEHTRARVIEKWKALLEANQLAAVVRFPSAAWLVEARKP